MKFKRLMALAMAGVMALGMSVTAMAEPDIPIDNNKAEIIEKKVEWEKGAVDLPNETFNFTLTGKANDDNDKPDPATPYPTLTGSISYTKDSDNTAYQKVEVDFSSLTTAGVYTFDVTEVIPQVKTEGMTYNAGNNDQGIAKNYKLKVYVKSDGTKSYTLAPVSDDGTVGGKVNTAKFLNKYTKNGGSTDKKDALVIKKVVSGSYADLTKPYDFNVTFTDGTYEKVTEYTYTIDDPKTLGDANDTHTIPSTGGIIKLKDGQSAKFATIPAGIKVTVAEMNVSNLVTTTIEASNGNRGTITKDDAARTVTNMLLGENENSITYTNTWKDITPAGLAISVAPFVAMFAAVGAAIALYVAAKRRVR